MSALLPPKWANDEYLQDVLQNCGDCLVLQVVPCFVRNIFGALVGVEYKKVEVSVTGVDDAVFRELATLSISAVVDERCEGIENVATKTHAFVMQF